MASRKEQSLPLTFEKGLIGGLVEESLIEVGGASTLENWVPEMRGNLRCRRGWSTSNTSGAPATRTVRGIGQVSLQASYRTPEIVQQYVGANTSVPFSTLAVDVSTPTVVGNCLVAVVTVEKSTLTITPPAGWTSAVSISNAQKSQIFYYANAPATSGDVTFTISEPDTAIVSFYEVSGIATTTPLDKTASSSGTSSTPATGTTAATTLADEFLIGVVSQNTTTAAPFSAPTNGFVINYQLGDALLTFAHGVLTKNQTATGAASSAVTSSASTAWEGAIATFKAAGTSTSGGRLLTAHDDGANYGIYYIDQAALDSGTWAKIEDVAVTDRNPPVAFTAGLGHVYYSHPGFPGTDIRKWDGTTVTAITDADYQAGRALAFHRNRLWSGGSTANPSRLHYSDLGDEDAWGATSYIDVNQDDGEAIEDLAPTNDGLVIAKRNSLWFLSGSGITTFQIHQVSEYGGFAGRCLCPTPFGVVVAGQNRVLLWTGGASAKLISTAINESYEMTGDFVSTAFIDSEVYICDEGTGTLWVYDFATEAWRTEKIDTNIEAPAVVYAHNEKLVYGPKSATTNSLLSYRNHPGSDRLRDQNLATTYKAHTAELWLGSAIAPFSPMHLDVVVRQRAGDASDNGILVTPVYDGTDGTALEIAPLATAGTFRKRLDIGKAGKFKFKVKFEHTVPTSEDANMDLERVDFIYQQEFPR